MEVTEMTTFARTDTSYYHLTVIMTIFSGLSES